MDREKRSLLVVDSSATYLFYMGMLLKRLDYTVRTSTTAEDALRTMADSLPSLVIIDTALPRMNGVMLLKHMKRDPRLKAVPVIVHTSERDPAVKEACTSTGCAGYLPKPADPDALYRAIQAATESAPRQSIRIDASLRVDVGDGVSGRAVRREYVTELSEGGLYIRSLTPEPVNAVIPLRILIGDRGVSAKAVVLYSSVKTGGQHKVPGMGVKFVDISREDKEFVRDFIKEQITKGLSMPG